MGAAAEIGDGEGEKKGYAFWERLPYRGKRGYAFSYVFLFLYVCM